MNDYVFRIGSLDVITWNARALCCADVSKRKKKINVLNDIAQRAGIVALQEVHGTTEVFAVLNRQLLKRFVFFSFSM